MIDNFLPLLRGDNKRHKQGRNAVIGWEGGWTVLNCEEQKGGGENSVDVIKTTPENSSKIVCGLNRGRDRQKGIQFRIDAQGDLTVCGAAGQRVYSS